eukprot:tig00000806_g4329.t1
MALRPGPRPTDVVASEVELCSSLQPCSDPRGCHPGGKCTRCGKHFTRQDNLYKHVRQCRKKAPATPRFDSSSAIPISSNMPHSCQMEGLDLAGLRFRRTSARRCQALQAQARADHHSHASARGRGAGLDAWLDPRPALRTSCTTVAEVAASQYSQLLLVRRAGLLPCPLLPAAPRARCFSSCSLGLGARRPARCFSFVDSRLCAGLGATCRSARFLARRPAGCFSFVDSRLRAGPGATFLSSDAAFPPATALACPPTWCRRPRRHPTYPPRHPARLAQPPALPL